MPRFPHFFFSFAFSPFLGFLEVLGSVPEFYSALTTLLVSMVHFSAFATGPGCLGLKQASLS